MNATTMTDEQLDAAFDAGLSAYEEREAYFATVPAWMFSESESISDAGPAAYGLSDGEWSAFLSDRAEHAVEGARLSAIATERRDRLREAARADVASRSTWVDAQAAHDRYSAAEDAARALVGSGDVHESIRALERYLDAAHASLGAMVGWLDAWESLEDMNAAMQARVYRATPDGFVGFRLVK